jgi:hypothetical protein
MSKEKVRVKRGKSLLLKKDRQKLKQLSRIKTSS